MDLQGPILKINIKLRRRQPRTWESIDITLQYVWKWFKLYQALKLSYICLTRMISTKMITTSTDRQLLTPHRLSCCSFMAPQPPFIFITTYPYPTHRFFYFPVSACKNLYHSHLLKNFQGFPFFKQLVVWCLYHNARSRHDTTDGEKKC